MNKPVELFPPSPNGLTGWPWEQASPPPPSLEAGQPWPKISIITPSFNQVQYLETTIRSVLLQGYPNLEYIVIDGGSSDGSLEIIQKYAPWLAHWVSEPDRGQSHALNKGFEHATGEWVAWINSDDIYLPGAFFKVGNAVAEQECDWLIGKTVMTDGQLRKIGMFNPELYSALGRDARYTSRGWLDFVCTKQAGISLPQQSSFWRREVVVSAGGINESIHYAMDHELLGRLARLGLRPTTIGDELACFRMHATQKTADYPMAFWKEELSIVYDWINRVNDDERETLTAYAVWLESYIDQYKYRKIWIDLKALIKKILKYRQ